MWWLPVLRRAALRQQTTTPDVARKVSPVLPRFALTQGWEYNAALPRKSVRHWAQFGHTAGCEYNSNVQGDALFWFGHCLGRQSKSTGSTSAA